MAARSRKGGADKTAVAAKPIRQPRRPRRRAGLLRVRPLHFHPLWAAIRSPRRFELLSYILISAEHRYRRWLKTPETRDGKRDAETGDQAAKLWLEAKFFEGGSASQDPAKLELGRVAGTLVEAFRQQVRQVWICTNGEIRHDLQAFATQTAESHRVFLRQPFALVLLNGPSFARLLLRFQQAELAAALRRLELSGYRSPTAGFIRMKEKQLLRLGTDLLDQLAAVRAQRHDFDFHPTLAGLAGLGDRDLGLLVAQLFVIEPFLSLSRSQTADGDLVPGPLDVPAGARFHLLLQITNYFFDELSYGVELRAGAALDLLGRWQQTPTGRRRELSIPANCRRLEVIEARAFATLPAIEISVDLPGHALTRHLSAIRVLPRLFATPFLGSQHLALLNACRSELERIDAVGGVFVAMFRGLAGVGKSRLVEELTNRFRSGDAIVVSHTLGSSPAQRGFLRRVLASVLGIEPLSFAPIEQEVLRLYADDPSFRRQFFGPLDLDAFAALLTRFLDSESATFSADEIVELGAFLARLIERATASSGARPKLLLLVVEDLHHAARETLQLLQAVVTRLDTRSVRFGMLLTRRAETAAFNRDVRSFEENLSRLPGIALLERDILDLSEEDALALLHEMLVVTGTRSSEVYRQILRHTGSNPFSIIHSLIHLKDRGAIVEEGTSLVLHRTDLLENGSIHFKLEVLLEERFRSYVSLPKLGPDLRRLLKLLVLFESKLPRAALDELAGLDLASPAVGLLLKERIIDHRPDALGFEHENIYDFARHFMREPMPDLSEAALSWCRASARRSLLLSVMFNCLLDSHPRRNDELFSLALSAVERFQRREDWPAAVHFGQQLLRCDPPPMLPPIALLRLRFHLAEISAEFANLQRSITALGRLELDLEASIGPLARPARRRRRDARLLVLLERVRITRADVLIQDGEYETAHGLLAAAARDIEQRALAAESRLVQRLAAKTMAWVDNRIGVTCKGSFRFADADRYYRRGIERARASGATYFLHHGLYDLAEVQFYVGNLRAALATHAESVATLPPGRKNSEVRTATRSAFLHLMAGQSLDAERELLEAIDLARRFAFNWELCRALVNLGALYLLTGQWREAGATLAEAEILVRPLDAAALRLPVLANLGLLHTLELVEGGSTSALVIALQNFLMLAHALSTQPFHRLRNTEILALLDLCAFVDLVDARYTAECGDIVEWQRLAEYRPFIARCASELPRFPYFSEFHPRTAQGDKFYAVFKI
jgi:tetratricopeptide (TPR) repeat protein